MRKTTVMVVMMVSGMLSAPLHAAGQDAAGCQDHPLVPRVPGYSILGCSADDAMADLDVVSGDVTESVHFEGPSVALLYRHAPDLGTTPSEAQVRDHFQSVLEAQGGSLLGVTYGQEWPVYTLANDGKEYWVVLMIKSGEYFTGSYTCRVIEKAMTPVGGPQ